MGRNCRSALEQVAGWEAAEAGEEANIYWQLRDNLYRYEKGYSKWQAQQLPPILEQPHLQLPRKASLHRQDKPNKEDKENEIKLPQLQSTPLKKPPKELFLSLKQKNLFEEVQHHTQPLKNSPTLLLEQIRSRRNRNLCNLKPLHDSQQAVCLRPQEDPPKKHKLLTICAKFRHSKLAKQVSAQLIDSEFNDDKITDFDLPQPLPPPSRSAQLP